MALSGSFSNSVVNGHYVLRVEWSASQSISGNYSDITVRVYFDTNYRLSVSSRGDAYVNVDGQQSGFTAPSVNKGSSGSWSTYTFLDSYSFRVYHDSAGNKSLNITSYYPIRATLSGTYYEGITASANISLNQIPRYANVSISYNSKTVNSITYNCSVDATIDWKQYRLNDGSWIDDGASNTIKNLSPNTSYKIQVRVRRKDSQLWSESNTITVSTYDIAKLTNTPNVNIGAAHTIKWSNPSGATTNLKLCKTDGTTLVYDVGNVTGTSKSITPTANSIYTLIPNSNTIKLRYIITTTCNGSNYINYKDCTFTVVNSNPTFSNFTYQDTNTKTIELTGNNQIVIKGYSNVKGIISTANKGVAKNSANMSKYRFVIGELQAEKVYSSNSNVEITLNKVQSNRFDMYAIDSRDNSTLKTISASTYKSYSNITIKSVKANRENNGIGSNVILDFNGGIWNANFGKINNSIVSCKYQYKKTNSSTWINGETDIMPVINGNSYSKSISIKGDLGADGFDVKNSYNIKVTITDKLSSYSFETLLGTGTPGIAITPTGIAFFNMYDEELGGAIQITGDLYINGKKINS